MADVAITLVLSGCSLVVGVYGLIYKHVSKIHEKIDIITKHVHEHDVLDTAVQTAMRKDIDAHERRITTLENQVTA